MREGIYLYKKERNRYLLNCISKGTKLKSNLDPNQDHQANKPLFQFDSKDLKIPKEMVYFLPGTLQCYDIPVYLRNTKVYIPTTT